MSILPLKLPVLNTMVLSGWLLLPCGKLVLNCSTMTGIMALWPTIESLVRARIHHVQCFVWYVRLDVQLGTHCCGRSQVYSSWKVSCYTVGSYHHIFVSDFLISKTILCVTSILLCYTRCPLFTNIIYTYILMFLVCVVRYPSSSLCFSSGSSTSSSSTLALITSNSWCSIETHSNMALKRGAGDQLD